MTPRVSKRTISQVQRVITGDAVESLKRPISPYRTGPRIVSFFNEVNPKGNYAYGDGFGSRWAYTEQLLGELNGTAGFICAIEAALDRSHFFDTEFVIGEAVAHLNKYLEFEGLELLAIT